jgi:carboxymethylenebutenolidase
MTASAAPDAMAAETISISGHNGDEIEAYWARPLAPGRRGGVVVIHHMPGCDAGTKEITRNFAAHGYASVCPNLFHRYAPRAQPADARAAALAAGGVPDEQVVGDVGGAVSYLRSQPDSNGAVGVIGFCSGGRQAYIAACVLDVDAVIDCYGGLMIMSPDQLTPQRPVAPIDMTEQVRAPLLGLFGADDTSASPEQVAAVTAELTRYGKQHEFHTFEGAGHAFFCVDRPSFHPAAALEGWQLIWAFLAEHLD